MSINIRHATNGKKTVYAVLHTDECKVYTYERKEDIPKSIRHYAPDGEPTYYGPDLARCMGIGEVLYPDFPKCGMPGKYNGTNCVAECCKYAVDDDWTRCPYFDNTYVNRAMED